MQKNNNKGEANMLLVVVTAGFICVVIFFFANAILLNHINSIMYTVKVDMFLLNRSAVMALNKNLLGKDIDSISMEDYLGEFKKGLRQNYGLNEELEGGNKLIQKIDILKYEYDTSDRPTIRTEIGVKVEPLVFKAALKDVFYYKIKQDVRVDRVAM